MNAEQTFSNQLNNSKQLEETTLKSNFQTQITSITVFIAIQS